VNGDTIDEIVDWQMRKRQGCAVSRPIFQVIDTELTKLARWSPDNGWIYIHE
jgi:hypothetical protein